MNDLTTFPDTLSDSYSDSTYTDSACCCDDFSVSDSYNADSYWNDDVTVPAFEAPSDPSMISVDSDVDGYAETTIIDVDNDGVADAAIFEDVATGEFTAFVDSDLDGTLDTTLTDIDGDGEVDDPEADPFVDPSLDPSLVSEPSVEVDDPNVHGDPMADITYHQAQPGPVDCLPTSVSMILSEVTGETVGAEEVVALANDLGVMTDSGMAPADGVMLLNEYGVDASLETGTLDDVRTMLDEGTNVIIGLDSADLYSQADGPFADDVVAGHAVVITGIDDEQGLVYINDPAFPDGAGVAIPIDEFEDAWQDTDNTMIVIEDDSTDPNAPTNVAGVPEAAILPLNFRVIR